MWTSQIIFLVAYSPHIKAQNRDGIDVTKRSSLSETPENSPRNSSEID
jgi:hypothetical protein